MKQIIAFGAMVTMAAAAVVHAADTKRPNKLHSEK
jgi:hypothetical protein